MKIKTAMSVQEEQPVFTFRIGVWQAANWILNGISLAQELNKRAFDSSGISIADPMHDATQTFKGAPDWAYEVVIKRSYWKECV
jgi:hypothetical protein